MSSDLTASEDVPIERPRLSLPSRIFKSRPLVLFRRVVLALVAVFSLYYGVLGSWMHRVDADLAFMPANPVEGGSQAVNMAIGLIERETVTNRWTANDPIFFPTGLQDNMQNFQRGLIRAVSRFTMELESQIGRMRGSSAIDPDLGRAVGLLQFPTDVWFFDFSQSLMPVPPAENQYIAAMNALRVYNGRVARREAAFEVRPDALAAAIERMTDELSSRAAIVDQHVSAEGFVLDPLSDDIFYFNKGMAYVTYLLLRELSRDFESVITNQGLTRIWEQTLESLRAASQQRPLIVLTGSGDNSFLANHLHLQGFYLKRAILQMGEVVNVIRASR